MKQFFYCKKWTQLSACYTIRQRNTGSGDLGINAYKITPNNTGSCLLYFVSTATINRCIDQHSVDNVGRVAVNTGSMHGQYINQVSVKYRSSTGRDVGCVLTECRPLLYQHIRQVSVNISTNSVSDPLISNDDLLESYWSTVNELLACYPSTAGELPMLWYSYIASGFKVICKSAMSPPKKLALFKVYMTYFFYLLTCKSGAF